MSRLGRDDVEQRLNNLGNLGYPRNRRRRQAAGFGRQVAAAIRRLAVDRELIQDEYEVKAIDAQGEVERRTYDRQRVLGATMPCCGHFGKHAAAQSSLGCLLLAPEGCGKELLAHYIHAMNRNKDPGRPIEIVNSSSIPGHDSSRVSCWTQRHCGIHNAPPKGKTGDLRGPTEVRSFSMRSRIWAKSTQAKVLRAIENKRFCRVGAETPTDVEIRVIAATNKDLDERIQGKKFRSDLFHRLATFTIHLPSLDRRPHDIPALFDYFLNTADTGGGSEKPWNVAERPWNVESEVYMPTERDAMAWQRPAVGHPQIGSLFLSEATAEWSSLTISWRRKIAVQQRR